ncbi:hypothetical protein [Dysgonomonas sp. GY617]|uniref:hypothetical protein n=1 Tax=Dysgonomonas sp. GY617 TaxID=2780420 RepID=UPI0018844875|nr:hypothetical protein [Dysgonomonas sp. GY617]MBF0578188.1 hypothetical protein [Dysgonomonas sp. GY617]
MGKKESAITKKEINTVSKLITNGKLKTILEKLSFEEKDIDLIDTKDLIKQVVARGEEEEFLDNFQDEELLGFLKEKHFLLTDILEIFVKNLSNQEKLSGILQILKLGPHYTKEDIIHEIKKL